MSFLAPLFLFGALSVGLPVIFHLIRRTTRERQPFSSLMFLLPSPPRLTRRSRLEHLLLLFLRCLVVCLLALAFARPFLKRVLPPAQPSGTRRLLLLVDTSASMRRSDLWSDARARVDAILRKTSPADQAAVFTFDRQLRPVLTFDEWNATAPAERAAVAAGKLAMLAPGWSDTRLGNALIQAAEILADTAGKPAGGPSQLVLVTDLQQGCHLEPVQGYEWPRGLQLSLELLQARHRGNASLQFVPDPEDGSAKAATTVRVRVSNNADSRREQLQVGWAGADGHSFVGEPAPIYVPAGQSRIVPLPLPAGVSDRVLLQGDDDDFDNTVFVVPPETERLTVLYLGHDVEKDPKQPLYFLQRAFQETRRRAVKVEARNPQQPPPTTAFSEAALTIVTDPLPEESSSALRRQVTAGKTVLFMLQNDAVAATLARLLGLERLTVENIRPATYALLADIDFRHPVFAPFADARFSDFTRIHFWAYRKLDTDAIPGARTLARFDSGDPAFLEVPLGKGRVLVLASGWQPDQSQLALSTKFVPLLYSILEDSGVPAPLPAQFQVGDSIPMMRLTGTAGSPSAVRMPDGSQVNLGPGETNFTQTLIPGVYTVLSDPAKRFAVNLSPAESLTTPLPVDELERLGAPVAQPAGAEALVARRQAQLANAEMESRQKLWRWALMAALVMLVFETWLGGRTARTLFAGAADGIESSELNGSNKLNALNRAQ